jgi:hypothetical protein
MIDATPLLGLLGIHPAIIAVNFGFAVLAGLALVFAYMRAGTSRRD